MKTISACSNAFEQDDNYIANKNNFNSNPYDSHFAKNAKESFKGIVASDFRSLINNVSYSPSISQIPTFIYDLLAQGKYASCVNAIQCIFSYYFDPAACKKTCSVRRKYSAKLKGNSNRKFGKYFRIIYKDAKKELLSFKRSFNQEEINKYRVALLFLKIVIRTFYFSALPAHISPMIFKKCTDENSEFANYYSFDSRNNQYLRNKFQKRGAKFFNETVAWWLVYNNMIHYGLDKK